MQHINLKPIRFHVGILGWLVLSGVAISGEGATGNTNCPSQSARSDSAAIWNNLANTYVERAGEEAAAIDTAMAYYLRAIKLAPQDGGIKLNLAIVYLMQDDSTKADSLFWLGYAQCDSSMEKVYNLLSMDYKKPSEEKGTPASVTQELLQERISASVDTKKKTKSGGTGKGKNSNQRPPSGGSKSEKGKKKKTTGGGGEKSLDPQEIKNYLYWRH